MSALVHCSHGTNAGHSRGTLWNIISLQMTYKYTHLTILMYLMTLCLIVLINYLFICLWTITIVVDDFSVRAF